ncbi:BRO-N domain-containing protein [Aureimonas ureilytica]|uniref:BRO-N domain-containing protein n=1 Tax=Aureimonas ureilytica TaxID=401562 RepID=UPI000733F302|nr:BRO family protein [Aureimonas ureilytica]
MSDLDLNRLNVGTAIIERTRRTLGVGAARQLWPMLGLPDLGGAAEAPRPQGATAFDFEGGTVRTVTIDGVTWFVGKDVAARLGYSDPTNAMKQHCRGVVFHHPISDALGREQKARVLSEADVLRLIVASKLPAAERFERWIFEVVLPEIRRTGGFRPGGGVYSADTLPSSGSASPAKRAADARHLKTVEQFIADCCSLEPDSEVQAQPLYQAYEIWEARRQGRLISQTRFGRIMRLAGFQKDRGHKVFYLGLALREDA